MKKNSKARRFKTGRKSPITTGPGFIGKNILPIMSTTHKIQVTRFAVLFLYIKLRRLIKLRKYVPYVSDRIKAAENNKNNSVKRYTCNTS